MKTNVIINIPNILAFIRLLFAPLIFFLLVERDSFILEDIHISWLDYFAGLCFALASVTDFFDGYIARKFNQITYLGEILDPLSDKILTLSAFLGLLIIDRVNEWAIFIIIGREIFITGLRISVISQNINISASFSGKVKTVFQMIAIGFLIMDWYGGLILLWIAVFFTIYSAYQYVKEYFLAVSKN